MRHWFGRNGRRARMPRIAVDLPRSMYGLSGAAHRQAWAQPVHGDAAVQTGQTMKAPFGMALRQIEPWERHWSERPGRGGCVESLLRLISLGREVPDFSTLSRRQKTLTVNILHQGSQGPVFISSTVARLRPIATVLALPPSSRLGCAGPLSRPRTDGRRAFDLRPPYFCSDGKRGRGGPVTNVADGAFFHSCETIGPPHRGITCLATLTSSARSAAGERRRNPAGNACRRTSCAPRRGGEKRRRREASGPVRREGCRRSPWSPFR